jgi:hypothetical protein
MILIAASFVGSVIYSYPDGNDENECDECDDEALLHVPALHRAQHAPRSVRDAAELPRLGPRRLDLLSIALELSRDLHANLFSLRHRAMSLQDQLVLTVNPSHTPAVISRIRMRIN